MTSHRVGLQGLVAWRQAVSGVRHRVGRQAVTGAGIALGIAFFCCVLVVRVQGAPPEDPQAPVRLQWLTLTSLVLCLVGVTNSMLMSVAERFREIGTIKCLGASDGFIVLVFFFESLIVGAVGSVVGASIGTLGMGIAIGEVAWPEAGRIVLLGTILGLAMTVVAAVAPAYQAAKMPAIAALRVEI